MKAEAKGNISTRYPDIGDDFIGPFSACGLAKYIVDLKPPQQVPDLGLIKLNKLIFIAHGWLLGKHRRPLVDEKAEVWNHGPVYRSLYDRLAHLNEDAKLPDRLELAKALASSDANVTGQTYEDCAERTHFDYICKHYGDDSAESLIDKTTREGSPWHISLSCGDSTISNRNVSWFYREAFKELNN